MANFCGEKGQYIRLIVVAAIGLACFVAVFFLVKTGVSQGFDDAVRGFFYDIRREWLTPVVIFITYLGNKETVTALCIILILYKRTRITCGIPVSIGAILVTVINKTIKVMVERPRPDVTLHLIEQGGYSFPSGHAITGMFVYGMLICLIRANVKNKKMADVLTVILIIPMIGIGLSRIYLGVHYPTDVLAGWSLGVVIIALEWLIFKKLCNGHEM